MMSKVCEICEICRLVRKCSFRSLAKKVAGLGYFIGVESLNEDPQKYCLRFHRKQAVTTAEIDSAVVELFHLAEKLGEDCDGWKTEIISDSSGAVQQGLQPFS
jgi:hypothetical protein